MSWKLKYLYMKTNLKDIIAALLIIIKTENNLKISKKGNGNNDTLVHWNTVTLFKMNELDLHILSG